MYTLLKCAVNTECMIDRGLVVHLAPSPRYLQYQCKKLVSLKHGVRATNQTENSTAHFCEDTRQNALAALTNLGHVTPFLLLNWTPHHLTIQWVREITSLDRKLHNWGSTCALASTCHTQCVHRIRSLSLIVPKI